MAKPPVEECPLSHESPSRLQNPLERPPEAASSHRPPWGQRAWPLRLGLFFAVNAGVLATLCLLTQSSPEIWLWAPLLGSASAVLSLFFSRWLATRHLTGVRYIDPKDPQSEADEVLMAMVNELAIKAGLPTCPKVGTYLDDEINAFATGWRRKSALVMFSTGLLEHLDENESAVRGVVAHELAHIANGDMLTLTLVQAVVNSLVVLVSAPLKLLHIVAIFSKDVDLLATWFIAACRWLLVLLLTFLGSLVVKWFSRWREFRADQGAAWLSSPQDIRAALQLLAEHSAPRKARPAGLQALCIQSSPSWLDLFSTHPALERRLARIQTLAQAGGEASPPSSETQSPR